MAINQISTSNTFAQWLVATQQLIDKYNYVETTANDIVIFVSNSENTMNSLISTAYSNTTNVYNNTVSVYNTTVGTYNNTVGVYNNTVNVYNTSVNTMNSLISTAYSNTNNVYNNTVSVYNNTNSVYSNTVGVYNNTVIVYNNTRIVSNTTNTTYANTVNVYNNIVSYVSVAYQSANNAANTSNLALIYANNAYDVSNNALSNNFAISAYNQANTATVSLVNDTTTDNTYYLLFTTQSSGNLKTSNTSTTKCYYNPSTGTLNSTVYNSLSDINQKKNIMTILNSLDTITSLRGVEFEWIDNGHKSAGIIAQELECVLPHLVTTEQTIKSVNYSAIIGYLIEAIKEQQIQINELRNIINK